MSTLNRSKTERIDVRASTPVKQRLQEATSEEVERPAAELQALGPESHAISMEKPIRRISRGEQVRVSPQDPNFCELGVNGCSIGSC